MTASAPRVIVLTRLNSPACAYPYRRLAAALADGRRTARGRRDSLDLRRRAFSSPSPGRFIPALSIGTTAAVNGTETETPSLSQRANMSSGRAIRRLGAEAVTTRPRFDGMAVPMPARDRAARTEQPALKRGTEFRALLLLIRGGEQLMERGTWDWPPPARARSPRVLVRGECVPCRAGARRGAWAVACDGLRRGRCLTANRPALHFSVDRKTARLRRTATGRRVRATA
jgi:hypothetical protein